MNKFYTVSLLAATSVAISLTELENADWVDWQMRMDEKIGNGDGSFSQEEMADLMVEMIPWMDKEEAMNFGDELSDQGFMPHQLMYMMYSYVNLDEGTINAERLGDYFRDMGLLHQMEHIEAEKLIAWYTDGGDHIGFGKEMTQMISDYMWGHGFFEDHELNLAPEHHTLGGVKEMLGATLGDGDGVLTKEEYIDYVVEQGHYVEEHLTNYITDEWGDDIDMLTLLWMAGAKDPALGMNDEEITQVTCDLLGMDKEVIQEHMQMWMELYDHNDDGRIDYQELGEVMNDIMHDSGMYGEYDAAATWTNSGWVGVDQDEDIEEDLGDYDEEDLGDYDEEDLGDYDEEDLGDYDEEDLGDYDEEDLGDYDEEDLGDYDDEVEEQYSQYLLEDLDAALDYVSGIVDELRDQI